MVDVELADLECRFLKGLNPELLFFLCAPLSLLFGILDSIVMMGWGDAGLGETEPPSVFPPLLDSSSLSVTSPSTAGENGPLLTGDALNIATGDKRSDPFSLGEVAAFKASFDNTLSANEKLIIRSRTASSGNESCLKASADILVLGGGTGAGDRGG